MEIRIPIREFLEKVLPTTGHKFGIPNGKSNYRLETNTQTGECVLIVTSINHP